VGAGGQTRGRLRFAGRGRGTAHSAVAWRRLWLRARPCWCRRSR